MLTFSTGNNYSFCDGIARRDFLRLGALTLGGLSLTDLLRLKAQGAVQSESSHKAVIQIFLSGGPPQMDMYDMKPEAPAEYRGPFKPIATNIPGMQICELMPLQAKLADKFTIINGMSTVGLVPGSHSSLGFLTAFGASRPPRPAIGSVVSRFSKSQGNGMPAWVNLCNEQANPSYLGPSHAAFTPGGSTMSDLQPTGVATRDRQSLLRSLDNLRRDLDDKQETMDAFTVRAMEMLSSTQVRDAFDLNRESPEVRARYGEHTDWLTALRLVQAGVSAVTVSWAGDKDPPSGWDLHRGLQTNLKRLLPLYDQAMAALITDLYDRGLDKDVVIEVCGEFGRTPGCVNGNGSDGRGHYQASGFAIVVGGGLRMGQVIGNTGPRGEKDISRGKPYTYQNLIATIYQNVLGINLETKVPDSSGRPQYLLEQTTPIAELL